jgi:hypothetical protein
MDGNYVQEWPDSKSWFSKMRWVDEPHPQREVGDADTV